MRNGRFLAASLLLGTTLGLRARGLEDVAAALENTPGYAAAVIYSVTLPQADDDVVYHVDLQQPGTADHYLIDWRVDTPGGRRSGFTAWFDDNFYDFRNDRLREVHGTWDVSKPEAQRRVRDSAQFAPLLPRRIAAELRAMTPDRYDVHVTDDPSGLRVDATRHVAGVTDAELSWVFDPATLMPVSFSAEYNPGAVSEQQVRAVYGPLASPAVPVNEPLSEAGLRALWPDAFGRCRTSTFGLQQLKGRELPAFSLPLATQDGRLTRSQGQPFDSPTAVVIFDPEATLTPQLVRAVRSAVDRLPVNVDVIWACAGKNPDSAGECLGTLRPGERALTGAAKLAAECGATALPAILACDAAGRVSDVCIGLNNQLDVDVIKMFSTMNN